MLKHNNNILVILYCNNILHCRYMNEYVIYNQGHSAGIHVLSC